jgi:hypothetical protein
MVTDGVRHGEIFRDRHATVQVCFLISHSGIWRKGWTDCYDAVCMWCFVSMDQGDLSQSLQIEYEAQDQYSVRWPPELLDGRYSAPAKECTFNINHLLRYMLTIANMETLQTSELNHWNYIKTERSIYVWLKNSVFWDVFTAVTIMNVLWVITQCGSSLNRHFREHIAFIFMVTGLDNKWGATWKRSSGSGLKTEINDHRASAALTMWHPSIHKSWH